MKPNFELKVGYFTLFAVFLLVWSWTWLHSISLFHLPQRFTVRFHDVAGLNTNAPVNINGVRIGTVETLDLKGKGIVYVGLKINTERIVIPVGSTFTIQTIGLVGAKYVEITLPEIPDGQQPQPLDSQSVVAGEDPVRVELVVNKIATSLGKIDYVAVEDKLSKQMESLAQAADSVHETARKFGQAADNAKDVGPSASNFFNKGTRSMDRLSTLASNLNSSSTSSLAHFDALADNWRLTSHKVNKILDNPALTADLKETAEKVRQTADSIQIAVHELQTTANNPGVRQDLLKMMQDLTQSTDNISKAVSSVSKMANDQELRSDVRQALADARNAMDKVNEIVNKDDFGSNLSSTMDRIKSASEHVDLAARQINQILDKRHPLIHMMLGRPGYINDAASQDVTPKHADLQGGSTNSPGGKLNLQPATPHDSGN